MTPSSSSARRSVRSQTHIRRIRIATQIQQHKFSNTEHRMVHNVLHKPRECVMSGRHRAQQSNFGPRRTGGCPARLAGRDSRPIVTINVKRKPQLLNIELLDVLHETVSNHCIVPHLLRAVPISITGLGFPLQSLLCLSNKKTDASSLDQQKRILANLMQRYYFRSDQKEKQVQTTVIYRQV